MKTTLMLLVPLALLMVASITTSQQPKEITKPIDQELTELQKRIEERVKKDEEVKKAESELIEKQAKRRAEIIDEQIKERAAINREKRQVRAILIRKQQYYNQIITNYVLLDIGRNRMMNPLIAREIRAQFTNLGPDAIPIVIEWYNYMNITGWSCPAIAMDRKLAVLLTKTNDIELIAYGVRNIGKGVNEATIRDRKVCASPICTMMRNRYQEKLTDILEHGVKSTIQSPIPRHR